MPELRLTCGKKISIHAPARGATGRHEYSAWLQDISIHAPARGATSERGQNAKEKDNFNPRSREGSDQRSFKESKSSGNFNPRSREGSDVLGMSIYHCSIKFQSTLPRGERLKLLTEYKSTSLISIHAPARGATSILSKIHPMFLTISHNASSFSSFPFHSFLPHLLNSSTFCALFQVRISRAFSVYYRFAPKKSTPDL